MSAFFLSLVGIVGLFAVRGWEIRHERVVAPRLRARVEGWALHFKELMSALEKDAEKLPPELLHLSRIVIHRIALALAALMRFLERKAHDLADLVSHKHGFRRRAPRSEFLNKMMEHKNGEGESDAERRPSEPDIRI